ncbi:general secretion pathway protein GspJ [Roseiarcus fermentans]|nr:general secretion pathway protein GspJ [Roseiarcus fermentans]
MGAIVLSLGAVAGQWLPNWHRGFGRVQRLETLDVGLQRLAEDLESAEYVTPNSVAKAPIFFGDKKTVTFVRVSNAPGTDPHLEFIRLAETVDERGFALVRSRAPFKPLDPGRPIEAQLYFADPVVLIRAPFRVSFAFAGADRLWRGSWADSGLLPTAARIEVRDAATDKVLALSTATLLHVDLPAECVTQKSVRQCLEEMRGQTSTQPPKTTAGVGNGP